MAIGYNIQFYRKKAGLSQEDLARSLFVSRQTISLWEKGQTVPTVDNLLRLREIFGVPVDNILVGEDGVEPDAADEGDEVEITDDTDTSEIPETTEEDLEVVPEKEPKKSKSKPLLRTILLLIAGLLCGTGCILLSLLTVHTGFLIGCAVGVLGSVGLVLLTASVVSLRKVAEKGRRRAMALSYPAVAALLCGVAVFCVMIPKTPLDRLSAKLSVSLPEAVGVSTDVSKIKLERMSVSARSEVYFSEKDASELAEKLNGAKEWKTAAELDLELSELLTSFDFLSGGDLFCVFRLSDGAQKPTLKAGTEYIAAAYFTNEGMLRIAEFILS